MRLAILLALCFAAESQAQCNWYPGKLLFGGRGCSSASVTTRTTCTTGKFSTVQSSTASVTVCDGNRCAPVRDVVQATVKTVANVLAAPKAAIDEVNALRARRGMVAYIHDEKLTQAAMAAATARAKAGIEGHLPNDFVHLPPGVTARCAGCAAWPAHLGFGACAIYERYTYCGAASVVGPNGKVFHHAFYR